MSGGDGVSQPGWLAPTLASLPGAPRSVLNRLAEERYRAVQLDATQPGMRPRELDQSARRDLLATLRRKELAPAGIDLWIPPGHFNDPATMDRAIDATCEAIQLAHDLGGCPISLTLPDVEAPAADEVIAILGAEATRFAVDLADHQTEESGSPEEWVGLGIDPAAVIAAGHDPAKLVMAAGDRLRAARLCDLTETGLRGPVGLPAGRLDVLAYRVALDITGFRGPVVLDCRQWAQPWEGLYASRRLWEQLSVQP